MVRRLAYVVSVAAGVVLAAVLPANAAPASGITVAPPFQQIVVGKSEKQVSFTLTNNEAKPQTLVVSSADFKSLDETGGVAFVGAKDDATKYGLIKWLTLDQASVTLAPKEQKTVTGIIRGDSTFAPGGHYGAVLFKLVTPDGKGTNEVSLKQVAASLLFTIKSGGEKYVLKLDRITGLKSFALNLPTIAKLRFYNGGNVHAVPRGTVQLLGPGGLVSKGTINQSSSLMLPESYRQYPTDLQKIAGGWLPGRYTMKVDYRYDSTDTFQTYSKSFLYIPLIPTLLLIGVIIALAIGVWFVWRRFSTQRF